MEKDIDVLVREYVIALENHYSEEYPTENKYAFITGVLTSHLAWALGTKEHQKIVINEIERKMEELA